MIERTLQDALAYSELAREFIKRDRSDLPRSYLHNDIVLLADEVQRLRELADSTMTQLIAVDKIAVECEAEVKRLQAENDGLKSGAFNKSIVETG
jgi:hypothetical protein